MSSPTAHAVLATEAGAIHSSAAALPDFDSSGAANNTPIERGAAIARLITDLQKDERAPVCVAVPSAWPFSVDAQTLRQLRSHLDDSAGDVHVASIEECLFATSSRVEGISVTLMAESNVVRIITRAPCPDGTLVEGRHSVEVALAQLFLDELAGSDGDQVLLRTVPPERWSSFGDLVAQSSGGLSDALELVEVGTRRATVGDCRRAFDVVASAVAAVLTDGIFAITQDRGAHERVQQILLVGWPAAAAPVADSVGAVFGRAACTGIPDLVEAVLAGAERLANNQALRARPTPVSQVTLRAHAVRSGVLENLDEPIAVEPPQGWPEPLMLSTPIEMNRNEEVEIVVQWRTAEPLTLVAPAPGSGRYGVGAVLDLAGALHLAFADEGGEIHYQRCTEVT